MNKDTLEQDILRLEGQRGTHSEHWEALIEEMRWRYSGYLRDGPATFQPHPGVRFILMEIVHYDQIKKLGGKNQ